MKKSNLVNRVFFAVFILAAGLLAFSCTDFFSTSWFPWAARNAGDMIPTVTTGNVEDLVVTFEDDPDASHDLLKKIQEAASGLSGAEENELQSAALEAAVNAVGLGQAVLGTAGNISNIAEMDADEVKTVLFDALNSLKHLDDTGDILSQILPDPKDEEAFEQFTNTASADDLAMAAMVLVLGEASKACDGDFNKFDQNLQDIKPYDTDENSKVVLAQAMAIAAVIENRTDELSEGPLKDVMTYLNLFK